MPKFIEKSDNFKFAFENSLLAQSITEPKGKLHFNEALCRLTGYTMEELGKMTWKEITHPEDIDLTQNYIDRMLKGEISRVSFEKRFMHKDGTVIYAYLYSLLKKDEMDEPQYFMTYIVDISKQKKAEHLLQDKIHELERFNTLTLDRELRMIELKKEVNDLLQASGKAEKYKIV